MTRAAGARSMPRRWVPLSIRCVPPSEACFALKCAGQPRGGATDRPARQACGEDACPVEDCRSANWRGVEQAALGPQRVQAASDLERAAHADIAVEALAVVTDLLDDVVDPPLVDTECLAHARGHAEDALDGGIVAL